MVPKHKHDCNFGQLVTLKGLSEKLQICCCKCSESVLFLFVLYGRSDLSGRRRRRRRRRSGRWRRRKRRRIRRRRRREEEGAEDGRIEEDKKKGEEEEEGAKIE